MRISVVPLVTGWLFNDDRTFDRRAPARKHWVPVIVWLVDTGRNRILFDSGACPPDLATTRGHHNYRQKSSEQLPHVLKHLGLTPSDIDAVVLSHLHWDHAGGLPLLPGAHVWVHKRELSYAQAPDPDHVRYYDTVATPAARIPSENLSTVDPPCSVRDEERVSLVPLPGHTPGSMGLRIEGHAGPVLLAGDSVPLWRNISGPAPQPNGIATDRREAQQTADQLHELADVIFPSHDPDLDRLSGRDVMQLLDELPGARLQRQRR